MRFLRVLSLILLLSMSEAEIDADEAAELSREIREHFRSSGANWVSPRMFRDEISLSRNPKPLMFVFTSKSCADCRDFMSSWMQLDKAMVSSLTAQFVAVLVLDDYMLEMSKYSVPEADYIPRVIFADPDGTVVPELKNSDMDAGSPYYYENAQQVVRAMGRALKRHWENVGTDVFPGDLSDDIP